MTDMGRMHIILGPPRSIERFEVTAGIYPVPGLVLLRRPGQGPADALRADLLPAGRRRIQALQPDLGRPGQPLHRHQGRRSDRSPGSLREDQEMAPTLATVSISHDPGRASLRILALAADEPHPGQDLRFPQKGHQPRLRHPFPQLQGDRQHGVPDQLRRERRDRRVVRDALLGHGLPPFRDLAPEGLHRLLRAQGPVLSATSRSTSACGGAKRSSSSTRGTTRSTSRPAGSRRSRPTASPSRISFPSPKASSS